MAASESELRQFLVDVAEIAGLAPEHPERIVKTLRFTADAELRFLKWGQDYLDGLRRPAGRDIGDAIKAELLARDEEVTRLRAEVESLRHALSTYERVQLAGRREDH